MYCVRKTEFMKTIKIFLLSLSAALMLNFAACGGTAARTDTAPENKAAEPEASMFASAYSGLSDDERAAAWLGVAGDGSCAVLCVFDTVSGKNNKWFGDFFDDGSSVIIADRRSRTDILFGYKLKGKDSYLIDVKEYGEILISKTAPYCLKAVIEEAE